MSSSTDSEDLEVMQHNQGTYRLGKKGFQTINATFFF